MEGGVVVTVVLEGEGVLESWLPGGLVVVFRGWGFPDAGDREVGGGAEGEAEVA